jgi:hypothetical protein
VKSAKVTISPPLKIRLMRRTGKRCRSDSSCGPDSAVLGCPMCPSSRIHRLAWRLVSLRRRGGREMWHANVSKKLKVTEMMSQEVNSSSRVVEYLF